MFQVIISTYFQRTIGKICQIEITRWNTFVAVRVGGWHSMDILTLSHIQSSVKTILNSYAMIPNTCIMNSNQMIR